MAVSPEEFAAAKLAGRIAPSANYRDGWCDRPADYVEPGERGSIRYRAEAVDHPAHYGGADDPYEAIKVVEAWGLGFNLGNTVKYVARAGKKRDQPTVQDLEKAAWYLNREIENLKKERQ